MSFKNYLIFDYYFLHLIFTLNFNKRRINRFTYSTADKTCTISKYKIINMNKYHNKLCVLIFSLCCFLLALEIFIGFVYLKGVRSEALKIHVVIIIFHIMTDSNTQNKDKP